LPRQAVVLGKAGTAVGNGKVPGHVLKGLGMRFLKRGLLFFLINLPEGVSLVAGGKKTV